MSPTITIAYLQPDLVHEVTVTSPLGTARFQVESLEHLKDADIRLAYVEQIAYRFAPTWGRSHVAVELNRALVKALDDAT